MGIVNKALAFLRAQRPAPPLLPAARVQVMVRIHGDKRHYNSYQVWQDGQMVAKSNQPVFQASIRPGIPFGILGRNGRKPEPVAAECAVLSNTQIPQDDGRWVRYPQLPAGQKPPTSSAMVQVPQIEQIMGFKLRYGPKGEAVLVPLEHTGDDGNIDPDAPDDYLGKLLPAEIEDGYVCGTHDFPPGLVRNLVSEVGANPKQFQLQSLVVPLDDTALKASIARARALNNSPAYQAFLDAFAAVYSTQGQWMRRLVITAPALTVLTKAPGAMTGLAKADPLTPYQWAQLAHQAQTGQVHQDGQIDAVEQHPLQEAFCEPVFRRQHYEIGSQTAAYAALRLTTSELATALDQPVDIVYWLQNAGADRLWAQGVARIQPFGRQSISVLENSIPGHVRRVSGVMGDNPRAMEQVHHAFLPGSPVQPPFRAHSIFHWGNFLETFARATDALGVACGDLVIGRTWGGRERPITDMSQTTNSILFLGPTGSGKTSSSITTAFSRTPLVIVLHVALTPQNWVGKWAKKLGGQFLRWEGEDVKSEEEYRNAARAVEDELEEWLKELRQRWSEGNFGDLPLVISWESGDRFLYIHYLTLILQKFLTDLGKAAKKYSVPIVVVCDDIVSAVQNANDPKIGAEAPNAARAFADAFHIAMDVCRHAGISMYATGHGFSSVVQTHGSGLLHDFPLALLYTDEKEWVYQRAELFYTPRVIPEMLADVEEGENGTSKPKTTPSGWRGYFRCTIEREILQAMGVPPYNKQAE